MEQSLAATRKPGRKVTFEKEVSLRPSKLLKQVSTKKPKEMIKAPPKVNNFTKVKLQQTVSSDLLSKSSNSSQISLLMSQSSSLFHSQYSPKDEDEHNRVVKVQAYWRIVNKMPPFPSKHQILTRLVHFELKTEFYFEKLIDKIKNSSLQPPNYSVFEAKFRSILFKNRCVASKYAPFLKILLKMHHIKKANEHIRQALYSGDYFAKLVKSNNYKIKSIYSIASEKQIEALKTSSVIPSSGIQRGIILPSSLFRRCWDLTVILAVIFNLIQIPLSLLETTNKAINYSLFTDLVVDGLFYFDILLNFRTGFVDETNTLELNSSKIMARYAKRWLLIDILATFPFDIFALDNNLSLTGMFKAVRLFRLGKILKVLESFKQINLIRLLNQAILFFLLAHWVGCFSLLFLNKTDVFAFLREKEREECFSASELGSIQFNTGCKYNIAVFNGFSLILNEDIEYYNTGYLQFLLGSYLGIQFAVSIFYGLMSMQLEQLGAAEQKSSNQLEKVSKIVKLKNASKKLENEVNIYFQYLQKNHVDMVTSEKLHSLGETLHEKHIASRHRALVENLTFLKRNSIDDKVLGFIVRKAKKTVYLPEDIIFHQNSISKGFYVLTEGKLKFMDGANKLFELPFIEEDDRNWLKMSGEEIRQAIREEENNYQKYFDLVALMLNSGRHYSTCVSEGFSCVFSLSLENFRDLLQFYPPLEPILLEEAQNLNVKYNIINAENVNFLSKKSSFCSKREFRQGKRLSADKIWQFASEFEVNTEIKRARAQTATAQAIDRLRTRMSIEDKLA